MFFFFFGSLNFYYKTLVKFFRKTQIKSTIQGLKILLRINLDILRKTKRRMNKSIFETLSWFFTFFLFCLLNSSKILSNISFTSVFSQKFNNYFIIKIKLQKIINLRVICPKLKLTKWP